MDGFIDAESEHTDPLAENSGNVEVSSRDGSVRDWEYSGSGSPSSGMNLAYDNIAPKRGSSTCNTQLKQDPRAMDAANTKGGPGYNSGFSHNSEKIGETLQNAFGKFINNTMTFGKSVIDNANTAIAAGKSDARKDDSTRAGGQSNTTKKRPTETGAILDQTANVIGGLRRNIVLVGESVIGQFTNPTLWKSEGESAKHSKRVHDLELFIVRSDGNSKIAGLMLEYVKFYFSSQTSDPYVSPHLAYKVTNFMHQAEYAIGPPPYDTIDLALQSSSTAADVVLRGALSNIERSPKKDNGEGSNKCANRNVGVLAISEMQVESHSNFNKHAYAFCTKLHSVHGYRQASYLNFSSTILVPGTIQSSAGMGLCEKASNSAMAAIYKEIMGWMIVESSSTPDAVSGITPPQGAHQHL